MKTNLSQVFVKRVVCEIGKSKQEFYDNEIKGFFLEVRANKSKTYFLKAIVDKKRVTKKIGDANVMDIKNPRSTCDRCFALCTAYFGRTLAAIGASKFY